jgi:LPS-assembly lipoprotein
MWSISRRALPLPLRAWAAKRIKVGGRGRRARSFGATLAPTPPPTRLPQREPRTAIPRRAFLALGSGAALAGCGFQPVYMPTASGRPGPAQRELAAINVDLIPDRPGQLLRQALQERFEGAGDITARHYDLSVQFWIAGQGIGTQQDSTTTRVRLIGRANWSLTAQDPGHTHMTSGSARAADALNNLDSQIFAADLENEAIQKRLAEALADQITLQLAAYFRKRAETTAAS